MSNVQAPVQGKGGYAKAHAVSAQGPKLNSASLFPFHKGEAWDYVTKIAYGQRAEFLCTEIGVLHNSHSAPEPYNSGHCPLRV